MTDHLKRACERIEEQPGLIPVSDAITSLAAIRLTLAMEKIEERLGEVVDALRGLNIEVEGAKHESGAISLHAEGIKNALDGFSRNYVSRSVVV